jgi:DNA helicase MCM8
MINKDPDNDETNKKINVRIHNYSPQTSLRSLRSNNIGKFVGLKGTVIRVSNVKPLVVSMPFKCARCGTEQYVRLSDGKFRVPTNCESGDRCRSKTFYPLRDKAVTVDWQKIRLQEIFDTPAPNVAMANSAEVGASLGTQGTTQSDAGRVPRTIEVELTEDLVDSVTPGDVISLAGVVKVTTTESRAGMSALVCAAHKGGGLIQISRRSAQCQTKQSHVPVLH